MSVILNRIAKVLALAESTDNEHEADAFMKKAQEMATQHSIELAVARRHVAKSQQRETPTMRTIEIGVSKSVGNAKMVELFLAIARTNDLTCNIAHNSTYVIAFGFPSDIEVVETLYMHIAHQMVGGANAYLKTGAHRDEVVYDPRTRRYRTPSGRAARLAFYDAFTSRIAARLQEAATAAENAIENARLADADEPESVGTALVLADKRAEISDFYANTSDARGSWRGGRSKVATPNSARAAGRKAGNSARLSAMPTLPGGKKSLAS